MGKTEFAGGYKFAKPSSKAKAYKASTKKSVLPATVDLRPFMTKVENQHQTSSCTANAVVGAYEYLFKRFKKESYDISRLFVYYNARVYTKREKEDSGSHIQYAMDSLKKIGACSEQTWAFGPKEQVVKQPPKEAYKEAKRFLVDEVMFVPVKLDAWKKTLADGYPIVFGTKTFESFGKTKANGIVSMPSPDEAGAKKHGCHAMLCVGYSDKDKMFIVRNSWGETWGEKGYCYIPYNYLMNVQWTADCWIIKKNKKLPNAQKAWVKSAKSVVNKGKGVKKSDVKVYHPRDYAHIPEDVFAYEFEDDDHQEFEENDEVFAGIMEDYELEEGEDEEWEDDEDIEDEDDEFEASAEDEDEDYEDTEFDEEDDYEFEEGEEDEEDEEDEELEDEELEDEELEEEGEEEEEEEVEEEEEEEEEEDEEEEQPEEEEVAEEEAEEEEEVEEEEEESEDPEEEQ